MKLFRCWSFMLIFVILENGAYTFPISDEYSFYDFDSAEEGLGLTFSDCIGKDCLNHFTDDVNKGDEFILDFSIKHNLTTDISRDKNEMPNEVIIISESTDKNEIPNNTYNKITDKNGEFSKSEVPELLLPEYCDESDQFFVERNDDNVETEIVDDIPYEDIPGILIICVVSDEGGAHNIDVDDSDEVTSDELTLNFNSAVQALADLINDEESSPEEGIEWTDETEPEDPHRIVENGYIFYDMGSQE